MADLVYAPLWCKSNFSFLEGASDPEQLVEQAHALGLPGIALTDRDGLYGVVRAHTRARELGVHLVLGAQTTLVEGGRVVLLARDRTGYGNLCQLLSKGRLRHEKGACSVHADEVAEHAEGLHALWDGRASAALLTEAEWLDAFCSGGTRRLHALVSRHRRAEEVAEEARHRAVAARLDLPIVAATEVLYHTPARRRLQDVFTCIRHGVSLDRASAFTKPNAEYALHSAAAFRDLFADDPDAVARSVEIAADCTFSLADLRYRYPSERLPDGTTSMEWLRQLSHEGAVTRYPEGVPTDVTRQIDKELDLIEELDYPGYFLTMWEIVRFCRGRGILCQGRGSAANSAVCYVLGITAVDPVRMGLLFERFLSRERREPPDIDLDIAHERREEVLQHVYEKYGRRHAAMVANVIRYRARSAIREVGKVLGIQETALDRMAKLASRWGGKGEASEWEAVLERAGLDPDSPTAVHLVELVDEIQDAPRHLSIHPGGFLLGHEPVDTIVPIENASMADRTVVQWDKDDLEELGLFKVDCLGLGALSLVDRALRMLREHRDLVLDLATIPAEDPATYAMCCEGDTVGVFQIESRAQMAMLPRLRPQTFYDLVIEISIVRPGPIAGDMVHPYLRRKHGQEPVTYPHPSLEPVLKKTLGVPLFQEQVMKLAIVAADYTPGEADQLRRDMAAWRKRGSIDRHRMRMVDRMGRKGIAREFAEAVFEQIRGFGEYGFPESHACSFALIAYATAWLKCHHPDVFCCALLNAWPMGFYSPATIVEDSKRHGVEVRSVDVVHSGIECSLEHRDASTASTEGGSGCTDHAVRMGLRFVKSLGEEAAERLAKVRAERPFADLADFVARVRLDVRGLVSLAEAGAFDSLEGDRRRALWQIWMHARKPKDLLPLAVHEPEPDFDPLGRFELVTWDYRASAHSARGHPLGDLRDDLNDQGLVTARVVRKARADRRVRTAGLVICRQRPGTAKGVVFLTLEDETGFVNVVVWQRVFDEFAVVIKSEPFLAVQGKIQRESGVVHVVADRFWVPQLVEGPAQTASRDFH